MDHKIIKYDTNQYPFTSIVEKWFGDLNLV